MEHGGERKTHAGGEQLCLPRNNREVEAQFGKTLKVEQNEQF